MDSQIFLKENLDNDCIMYTFKSDTNLYGHTPLELIESELASSH